MLQFSINMDLRPRAKFHKNQIKMLREQIVCNLTPRRVLLYKEVGRLGPDIKFRGKIWGKVRPSSPNKRKNLGSSVGGKSQFWSQI